ncbi:MAG: SWIM zinc finger family protein, partial [Planctomycetes bacterium]|nr:SWIM zinc finger family protein [Planctomycetota bacterium]
MPAELQPWHAWFDAATIRRAVPYASDGDVERVRRDGESVVASVQGHQAYRVHIAAKGIRCDPDRGILLSDLESTCSCPVAWLCKHAAAALIALARSEGVPDGLDEEGDSPAPDAAVRSAPAHPTVPTPSLPVAQALRDEATVQFGAWLRSVGQREGTWSADHRLCWHLLPPKPGEARWRIVPVLAKRLKSGGWGVGKRFGEIGRVVEQLGASVPHADGALLRRIAALRHPHHVWEDGWLDSACGAGGDLIAALVDSGVCYVESFAHGPLRQGPSQRGELAWRGSARDGWRLDIALQRGRLIPTWPPWYVDGDIAGPIDTDLDAAAFDALHGMPVVPTGLLPTALPVLARLVPGLPDAPVAPSAIPPTGYMLRCRVRFAPQNGYLHAGFDTDALAVWMRYGDVLVDADGAAAARAPDGRLVVRDLPAEHALLAQLSGLGLATDLDLKLARGAGAPRAGVPLALHRAGLELAQRDGQQRV